MPVVVTGASGRIGRLLVPRLAERGEVRAVVRNDPATTNLRVAAELRAAGAKVAVLGLGDASTLTAVMDGAHTVVHLAGGVDLPSDDAYEEANRTTVEATVEAAVEAAVVRFLFLSSPRASSSATNVYLRAKAEAEAIIARSGLDHLILRCTHVAGPGMAWFEDAHRLAARFLRAAVVGTGAQRLAPVHVDDLIAALLAADDRVEPISGVRSLSGAEVVTLDEVIDLLARRVRRKARVAPDDRERAAAALGREVHPAWLDLLASDSLPDAPDAAGDLGVEPIPLRASLVRAEPP